jgi:DNA-directed RNA polymerase II subunit RPB2
MNNLKAKDYTKYLHNNNTTTVENPDLWTVLNTTLCEGQTQYLIESMNDYYGVGIDQIMSNYVIEGSIVNPRDKTPEDRNIKTITYKVSMSNTRLGSPETNDKDTGESIATTPIESLRNEKTYKANIYVDVDITATAFKTDGTEETLTGSSKNFRLAAIPIMVNSNKCNLYKKPKEAVIGMHESPSDFFAYFIINGKEWSIDTIESVCFNIPRIYKNAWKTELTRLEFISKPGDHYENSAQIIIRLWSNFQLTIELVNTNNKKIHYPFYLIFRALGWSTDIQWIQWILQRGENESPNNDVEEQMELLLHKCFMADYGSIKDSSFGGAMNIRQQTDVLEFIIKNQPSDNNMKERVIDLSIDENLHKLIDNFKKRSMDNGILPHIGTKPEFRDTKCKFLCDLYRQMFLVYLGILPGTDRDSWVNSKRAHTPGVSSSKVFKTHVNSIVIQIKKQYARDFRGQPFSNIDVVKTFETSTNGADFERHMSQSIKSGNQAALKVNQFRTITNRLSSRLVQRKGAIETLSTLRTIVSPSAKSSGKSSERAKEMRRVHATAHGFICCIQSPDSGENVGIPGQPAITTDITRAGNSIVLRKHLENNPSVIPYGSIHPARIKSEQLGKICVNGYPVGFVKNSHELIDEYTKLRRNNQIERDTTISWESDIDIVYFWTDYGRLIRPMVRVVNNIRDWEELGLTKPAEDKDFRQHVLITKTILDDINKGVLNHHDLINLGIMERITPSEQVRLKVAPTMEYVRNNERNIMQEYTHVDHYYQMIGLIALAGPAMNMNATPRNVFETSQLRQTNSESVSNWYYRIDKDTSVQHQLENPIVRTVTNDFVQTGGATTTVAVMTYGGYNEEDSLAINAATGESGKYVASYFNNKKVIFERTESMGKPDFTNTFRIKKHFDYSKINDEGHIQQWVRVEPGDVVVSKQKKLPRHIKREQKYEYIDLSESYTEEFGARIHDVTVAKDEDSKRFCKIGYQSHKPIVSGDKFSSRHGQKGICGIVYSGADMPFTESGMSPDILMNPHAFPSRMTIAQLYESVMGIICAFKGVCRDLSVFTPLSMTDLINEMKELSLDPSGDTRLYCGFNGNWINTKIFMGPVFYQRLQKYVSKQVYSISVGPTDILTRQPLSGKSKKGGLKLGEMERDTLLAHGAAVFLQQKFFLDSDDFEIFICRCGERAIVNKQLQLFRCKNCGDNADISAVASSWTSKLFFNYLSSMAFGTIYILEQYEQYEDAELDL